MKMRFHFIQYFGRPRPSVTHQDRPEAYNIKSNDSYEFFLNLGPVRNVREKYFDDSIRFWPELMNHPDYDDFWTARCPLRYLSDIKPAVLLVGGWFDAEDLYGTLMTYKTIEDQNPGIHNTLIMGPWDHHQWAREMDQSSVTLPGVKILGSIQRAGDGVFQFSP